MTQLFKRLFDVIVSFIILVILAPVMMLVALLILLTMGRPILFRQQRPGLHGQPFEMIKFRSMRDEIDPQGKPLPDSNRLTRLGHFLRSSSLDELPEFYNVMRGEMSLVGPRPLLMEYLDWYTKEQSRRHDMKPGITGWAQVNGRNAICWEEKFKLDVWYVDNHGLWLDIRILFWTVWKVLTRKDINADFHATMPEFKGSSTAR